MRFYGFTGGYGSYAQVLRGFREGFAPKRVPVYAVDDTVHSVVGANHKVGVFLAPPAVARVMLASQHEKRIVMIAPNSTWLPEDLMGMLEQVATELITPSDWATWIVQGFTRLPVSTVPHGISQSFKPSPVHERSTSETYDMGAFDVVHLASTGRQRKGTRELVAAWRLLRKEGALPEQARLFLVLPSDEALTVRLDTGESEDIKFQERLNLPPAELAALYTESHVICQPSRGEAFGMVPLEALASGTPVVATTGTGHEQWVRDLSVYEGFVRVEMGRMEPIDDGPGAHAPSLDVETLARALEYSCRHWKMLKEGAMQNADQIREKHSWKLQLAAFRARMEREE